jgi:hypothetical protein
MRLNQSLSAVKQMAPATQTIGERSRPKRSGLFRLLAVCALIATSVCPRSGAAESVRRMSPQELKQQIDRADLIVIDVRTPRSWSRSDTKIAGAVREDASRVDEWAHKYPKSKTLVFYCA